MENKYDFDNGRFTGKFNSVSFELNIRKPIIQIMGDSGTGKTLLVNSIKADKLSGRYNGLEDYANVVVFDSGSSLTDLTDITDSLVIVDRGDLILEDNMVDYIKRDRANSYLIFARVTLPLGISPNYYGEFKVGADNVIRIEYMFSEVGWF